MRPPWFFLSSFSPCRWWDRGLQLPWGADTLSLSLQRPLDMVLLVPELTFMTGLPELRRDSRTVKVRACLRLLGPAHPSWCCPV